MKLLFFLCICFFSTSCRGPVYSGSAETIAMCNSLHGEGEKLAKEWDLSFLEVGNATQSPDVLYCLSFACDKKMRIDQARPLATAIVKEFLSLLRHNPNITRFMQSQKSTYLEEVAPSLDTVGLKIAFFDSKQNPMAQPYLAQITYCDRYLFYYKTDSQSKGLKLVLKELYDDALCAL